MRRNVSRERVRVEKERRRERDSREGMRVEKDRVEKECE